MPVPKVSIIVPVYNVSQYLEKCLESIVNQTLEDIEIIIINDCSPDPIDDLICQEYAEKDDRIVYVIHEENIGLGGARNTGIKLAKAEYIGFVDSDDFIDSRLYEVVYYEAIKNDNDIVVFGFCRINNKLEILSKSIPSGQTEGDLFKYFLTSRGSMNPASWNKLWKKSLYVDNNIKFPEHIYYQDLATTSRILYFAENVKFLNEIYYYYLVREKSITLTYSIKHIDDLLVVLTVLSNFIKSVGAYDEYNKIVQDRFHRMVSHHISNGLKNAPYSLKKRIASYFRKKILDNNLVDTKHFLSRIDYLESHIIFDGIHPYLEKIDDLSILVKTFLRPENLQRFLESVGEYQNKHNIQFHEVIIGDDSSEEYILKNRKAISNVKNRYPFININHRVFPYYVGCAEGRNGILDACQTKYFLSCDDDFILDNKCTYLDVLKLAKKEGTDIIGGWVKNNYIDDNNYSYWGSIGNFTKTGSRLIVNLNEHEDHHPYYERSDFLLNFFIGNTKSIKKLRWDPELKTEEHYDFFYRAYTKHLRTAFTNTMFVKHTPSRKTNIPLYNEFRYKDDTWKKYLFLSVKNMGVEERVINRWRKNTYIRWSTNCVTRANENLVFNLQKPIFNQRVVVKQITPKFEHHFFGYFDVLAMDSKEEKHLSIRVQQTYEIPNKEEIAEICLIDTAKNNEVVVIGTTKAWCFQQGCFLQFMPGNDNEVIYNIYDEQEKNFKSIVYDIKEQTEKLLPLPISNISACGKNALSINFSRLYDYRPGYGYNNKKDTYADLKAPENDGVFLLDLKTKKYELILSYKKLWEVFVNNKLLDHIDEKLVINHINFNTDGSKFILLLRFFSDSPPFPTLTITSDISGNNLQHIYGFVSHYHWKDKERLCITGDNVFKRGDVNNITLRELSDATGLYEEIDEEFFIGDGHCSYSPDKKYMLYDSYSSKKFPFRKLQIYDLERKKGVTLGHFYSDPVLHGENVDCRCDLHPRWSPGGNYITFDSMHNGYRGIYQIRTEDAIRAINNEIEVLSEDDIKSLMIDGNNEAAVTVSKTIENINRRLERTKTELEVLKQDRWYIYGRRPTKEKIRVLVQVISKKTRTYGLLKILYSPVRYIKTLILKT